MSTNITKKIEISIKKEIEETKEITTPCFWKSEYEYVAVLDEDTAVKLFQSTYGIIVSNMSPDCMENDIKRAYENFNLCTEEEFMEAYSKAYEAIRLTPIVKSGMLYDQDKVDALKNSIAY